MFDIPEHFRDMVMYDSGPAANRIIIMGCNELLDGLARADTWLCDGMFTYNSFCFYSYQNIVLNSSIG